MGLIRVRAEWLKWFGKWQWRYTAFCNSRICKWHSRSYPAWLFQRAIRDGEVHYHKTVDDGAPILPEEEA